MLLSIVSVCLLIGRRASFTNAGCTNDFEDGPNSLIGWTKTGNAFDNQPTYGDNPSIRKNDIRVNHHGNYWIGTYESRPNADSPPGMVQSDIPTGTLTSPEFKITGSDINFLIGGGCDQSKVRAELLINGSVAEYDTGKCSETMRRVHWSVGKYKGRTAKIRLVDKSKQGWGHLNFDDLKGDMECKEEKVEPIRTFLERMKDIIRPTKHTSFISDIDKLEERFNADIPNKSSTGSAANKPTENTSDSRNRTTAATSGKMHSDKTSETPTTAATSGKVHSDAPSGSPTTAATSGKVHSDAPSGSPTTSATSGKVHSDAPSGSPTTAATSGKVHSDAPSGSPTSSATSGKVHSDAPSGSPTTAARSGKMHSHKPSGSPTTSARSGKMHKLNESPAQKKLHEITPSKRMTTSQMNIKMKYLERLLYQGTTNKKHGNYNDLPDVKCKAKFFKVGCFADKQSPPRPLNDLLFNEKDQNNFQNAKHAITRKVCRCAEEAKKRNFKVFGLQFFGNDECWSGKDGETTYNVDKTSRNCYNNDLKPCTESDSECVGGPDANYVYRLRSDNANFSLPNTQNSSESTEKTLHKRKPVLKLQDSGILNNYSLKNDQSLTNFKNLNCKEFLIGILLKKRWRDDLKNPNTLYYKDARENIEVKMLNLYGEDEDFRGIQFERFTRTENRNTSKVYVVLKFDNTDKYLTKLIDDMGTRNVIAAGCYESPPSCPGSCSSKCAPSCQSSCCAANYQSELNAAYPMNNPYYQNSQPKPTQPMIVYNTPPPQQEHLDPTIYTNTYSPLAGSPFSASRCPVVCQIVCSTRCPQNCCLT